MADNWKGGPPFPRNVNELMQRGLSEQQAEHKMNQEVFGHDYQTGKSGAPVERGKGSASQQTAQHMNALAISQDAEASRKMRMGWHPGMDHAYEPSPKARRRKAARRKPASSPVTAEGNA